MPSSAWHGIASVCTLGRLAWETGLQAKAGIAKWISFYNRQRPHAAHGKPPPAVVYFNQTAPAAGIRPP
ncbi:integrase core domain-containing protein [Zhengella mangrovi]|uniref:integrase core domain-containing protein n=1 Tax=Zhengella mangrovi TaxID=1982044 RepID=UPI003CC9CCB0